MELGSLSLADDPQVYAFGDSFITTVMFEIRGVR
jgi:hypothetical protein